MGLQHDGSGQHEDAPALSLTQATPQTCQRPGKLLYRPGAHTVLERVFILAGGLGDGLGG